jgi:hypothetical protein
VRNVKIMKTNDFNQFIKYTTENVAKIAYDASVPLSHCDFDPVMYVLSEDVARIAYSITISLLRQYHQWCNLDQKRPGS